MPLLRQGDDLPRIIKKAVGDEKVRVEDGDIFVVAQKAISKTRGLVVDLNDVKPSRRAIRLSLVTGKDARFVELILRGTAKILKAIRKILLTETVSGDICLNAGVDKSNVEGARNYSLLPIDPAGEADRLRRALEREFACSLSVLIADTFSRPFRRGQVEYAIGGSGVDPILDYRGQTDLFGYRLQFKSVAVCDELVAAAELVMGQGTERVPVAVIKGFKRARPKDEGWDSRELHIRRLEDLFRGTL
jgi:coenzyme F420-0:L-glutamate ligase/coenzyme F420-1:gamma-L-glutamate ligase